MDIRLYGKRNWDAIAEVKMMMTKKIMIYLFIYLFYLDIYPPDSQKSEGGANT